MASRVANDVQTWGVSAAWACRCRRAGPSGTGMVEERPEAELTDQPLPTISVMPGAGAAQDVARLTGPRVNRPPVADGALGEPRGARGIRGHRKVCSYDYDKDASTHGVARVTKRKTIDLAGVGTDGDTQNSPITCRVCWRKSRTSARSHANRPMFRTPSAIPVPMMVQVSGSWGQSLRARFRRHGAGRGWAAPWRRPLWPPRALGAASPGVCPRLRDGLGARARGARARTAPPAG